MSEPIGFTGAPGGAGSSGAVGPESLGPAPHASCCLSACRLAPRRGDAQRARKAPVKVKFSARRFVIGSRRATATGFATALDATRGTLGG
jgi:hypothetical protein